MSRVAATVAALVSGCWLLMAPTAKAQVGASFFILNVNLGSAGFNDPTPVAPVGGNPGRTLGEQRLAVFERATALWGVRIESDVLIVVQSQMNGLFCEGGAAVLGTAASFTAARDFEGAPLAETWYPIALARSLAGEDLTPGYPDMFAIFNSAIDDGCIPGIDGWYYGLDGRPPPGTIELLPIVLHELAHGLGFANLAREETGSLFRDLPDIYTRFTFDHVAGQTWADMATDAERAASALRCGDVSWSGPRVIEQAADFLEGGAPRLAVIAPDALSGPLIFGRGRFGPPFPALGLEAPVVLADDGVGESADACEGPATGGAPWPNADAIDGAVVLADRGLCLFEDKVRNAEASGAVAVLVADTAPMCPPFDLVGMAGDVGIPSARIAVDDGQRLREALPGVQVRFDVDSKALAGTYQDTGQVLLYATDPLIPGSAISHFDTSPFPDLLMEPFANLAGREIDLTLALMRDIGWRRAETALDVPSLSPRGLAILAAALFALGVILLRSSGGGHARPGDG